MDVENMMTRKTKMSDRRKREQKKIIKILNNILENLETVNKFSDKFGGILQFYSPKSSMKEIHIIKIVLEKELEECMEKKSDISE